MLSWWYSAGLDWPLWQRLAVFIAVRRHHGPLNFQDWPELFEQTRAEWHDPDSPLRQQVAALDLSGIHAWLAAVAVGNPQAGLSEAPEPLTLEHIDHRLRDRQAGGSKLRRAFAGLDDALAMLAGFGALLAVDKTDAALQGGQLARQALPTLAVSHYKAGHLASKHQTTALNQRREAITATVTDTWLRHLDQPLLTLTAPTGAGKTLTVLHAALQARAALETRTGTAPRILYCLPFTSVIDQNHAVFRTVLRANALSDREDRLLKHHHLSDSLFRTEDAEYQGRWRRSIAHRDLAERTGGDHLPSAPAFPAQCAQCQSETGRAAHWRPGVAR